MTLGTPAESQEDRGRKLTLAHPVGLYPLLGQLLVTVLSTAAVLSLRDSAAPTDPALMKLAWIATISFALHIALLSRQAGGLFRPIVAFSVFVFMFSGARLLLLSFGNEPEFYDVVFLQESSAVYRAFEFVIIGYGWFALGAILIPLRKIRKHGHGTEKSPDWGRGLKLVGSLCLVLGLPAYAISSFHNFQVVTSSGYMGYFAEGARIESSFVGLSYFFVTGLVFLGCSGHPRLRAISVGALVLISVQRLLLGDRGEGFIMLFAAYFVYSLCSDEQTRNGKGGSKRRIWSLALTSSVLLLVPVIGALRQTYGGNGRLDIDGGIFSLPIETISTVGTTVYPTIKIVELVDQGWPLANGLTYAASVARVLPSILRFGHAEALVDNDQYGNPGQWLQDFLELNYGQGFTPFAEAYLNFGFIGGVGALFLLGVVFGMLFRLDSGNANSSLGRIAWCIAVFALVAFVARGSLSTALPFIVRYVAIPMAFVIFVAYGYPIGPPPRTRQAAPTGSPSSASNRSRVDDGQGDER